MKSLLDPGLMDAWGSELDDTFRYVFPQEAFWGATPKFVSYCAKTEAAIQLACPILQLHSSPWLGVQWTSKT